MSTVNQKMTAIADNIRSFTGATEPLTLDDMAQGINDVYKAGQESGGDGYDKGYEAGQTAEYDRFWDNCQVNGNRTNYYLGFAGSSWNKETFKPKYDIKPNGSMYMIFNQFNQYNEPFDLVERLKECGVSLDFSNVTGDNYAFYNANVTHIGVVDLRNCTSMQNTFLVGDTVTSPLKTIDKVILKDDGKQKFYTPFSNCASLENIIFEGVIGNDISFASCSKLTHDSLMSIINALKDYSGTTTTKTLTLHVNSKALLTDTEKAIAEEKGWTIV